MLAVSQFIKVSVAWICIQLIKLVEQNRFINDCKTHLKKQLAFINSSCEPFTKNKGRIQKFKETGNSTYLYQNELDKTSLQHDIAYGDFQDLLRRTVADDDFNITKNRHQRSRFNGL